MLVDSHCHLDYLAAEEPLPHVLSRARDAGVVGLLTISTKLSTFPDVRAIVNDMPGLWCSVGVHPHHADEEGQATPERLMALADDPRVIGIGETGLDYFYDNAARDAQERSFKAHIEASRATGLPLIVHTRDADADTARILEEAFCEGPFTGLIHCFTAGRELADTALRLGFYLSVSGIVTFKNAQAIRDTIKAAPMDRLLVETDAPYLAPIPMRGKRNEPAFVGHTARALADLKGLPYSEVERLTTENFFRLFGKADRSEALDL